MSQKLEWLFYPQITAKQFFLMMLEYGSPIETSIVGAFDQKGRGSRRDIPLPLHRDGDYSKEYSNKINYIGLFCLKEGGNVKTLIEDSSKKVTSIQLKNDQAIIINNKLCRHGRTGCVQDRLLLRIWV